jgi:hypothetical protein
VDDTVTRVSALLTEVAETHHRVYRIVEGADDDWASWYAQWLIELSELPALLGARPVRSHLIAKLVTLDRQRHTLRELAGLLCRRAHPGVSRLRDGARAHHSASRLTSVSARSSGHESIGEWSLGSSMGCTLSLLSAA